MKSLKPRILTAVFGIALLIAILIIGEIWYPVISVIVGIAASFMTGEYLNAKKLIGLYPLSLVCMAFPLALSLLIFTDFVYLLLSLFFAAIFTVLITNHKRLSYSDMAYSVFGTLLISFGMCSITCVCKNSLSVAFYFITIFALPWMADAGGFFMGGLFGKRKLCPSISPKKTIEGVVGGVVFCIISALLLGVIFNFIILKDAQVNFVALILLGIIDAPLSVLGDLSFSLIKRSLGIKDYGSVFPGHGGMLDRFDSIIFTAPAILVVNQFLPFVTAVV